MATNYALCILGAMDRLWFHQIILFSEPEPLITDSSPNTSQPDLVPQEETPSVISSMSSLPQDECNINEESNENLFEQISPTGMNLTSSKTHSQSPPSTRKRSRKCRYSSSVTRLQKTMSCKSLHELELEELQGFMDLGFIFKKEQISPQIMRLVPGLQRLGESENENKNLIISANELAEDDEIEEEEEEDGDEERGVLRPYLSEAWLVQRHDSPLLKLRIPRVYAAADMKKYLKFWARNVASAIQQES